MTGTMSLLRLCLYAVHRCTFHLNYDQQDATMSVYLFILSQLYMFRAMSSPIIRST